MGKPLVKKMSEQPGSGDDRAAAGLPDFITSDCPLGGHHIAQGFEVNGLGTPELQHPLSLVRIAYGIK
jgi:hypothetical protein